MENAFLEQLLATHDKYPGIKLIPCFPYHKKLVLESLDLFHGLEHLKNVAVVSPINFSHMIGAEGNASAINRQMANVNSSLLHNPILNPRLLDPSTYKLYPLVGEYQR